MNLKEIHRMTLTRVLNVNIFLVEALFSIIQTSDLLATHFYKFIFASFIISQIEVQLFAFGKSESGKRKDS